MIGECPQCGSEISWLRPGPDRCGAKGCAGQYSDARKQNVSQEVADLMLLMGAAARLPGVPRASALIEAGPLDLADILRLAAIVAMPRKVLEARHPRISISWLYTFDPEEVIDCAAGVLSNWPHQPTPLPCTTTKNGCNSRADKHQVCLSRFVEAHPRSGTGFLP